MSLTGSALAGRIRALNDQSRDDHAVIYTNVTSFPVQALTRLEHTMDLQTDALRALIKDQGPLQWFNDAARKCFELRVFGPKAPPILYGGGKKALLNPTKETAEPTIQSSDNETGQRILKETLNAGPAPPSRSSAARR